MARWIIQVIKESLSRQESQLAGSHVRAHDLRAQMASWALYKGALYPGSHGSCWLVIFDYLPVCVPEGPVMCSSDDIGESPVSGNVGEPPQAERLGGQDSFLVSLDPSSSLSTKIT